MVNDSNRGGNRFILMVPVKRRRAMLASNPLRNSRSELVATMSRAWELPVRPYSLGRPRPECGTSVQVYMKEQHIGAIDSAMP